METLRLDISTQYDDEVTKLFNLGYGRGRISTMLSIPQSKVYNIKKRLRIETKPGIKAGVPMTEKQIKAHKGVSYGTKHGMYGHKIYRIYYCMTQRCNNKKSYSYHSYGGRGIKCKWESFESFMNDMLPIYNDKLQAIGEKKMSIERIDNDGDYCKENCTFIHKDHQQRNQQRHKNMKRMVY